MKSIRVLGSGDAFHEGGRAHSSCVLESKSGDLLLLDFGATSLYALQRTDLDPKSLDALLITHLHGDHIAGIPFLLLYFDAILKRGKPFAIWGPGDVEKKIRAMMEIFYPGHSYRFPLEFYTVFESPFAIKSFEVQPFPITHMDGSTGYRIGGPGNPTVAFSGDSAFDTRLFELVDGVDLAILEASLLKNTEPPMAHISVEELRRGRENLKARELRFTHMSDASVHALEELWPGSTLQDGMVVELDDRKSIM